MKLPSFELVQPRSLEEVCMLLSHHGDDAKVLAGGQSLLPLMAFRLAQPSVLVDLGRVDDLGRGVEVDSDALRLGALATHRMVERAGIPQWAEAVHDGMQVLGHAAIRNRGTVGGSIAHADPAAEWPALLVGLDGHVRVVGPTGERTIGADSFFENWFTTAVDPGEVVTEICFPPPSDHSASALVERGVRSGDFASAGCVVRLSAKRGSITNARVTGFAAGPRPQRLRTIERLIVDAPVDCAGGLDPASLTDGITEDLEAEADSPRDRYRLQRLLPAMVSDALRSARERLAAHQGAT
jgi:carbon-monoxide dehydrogenase medium subunit